MPIRQEEALAALATVVCPTAARPITELGLVEDLRVTEGNRVSLTLVAPSPHAPRATTLPAQIESALRARGAAAVDITVTTRVSSRPIRPEDPLPHVKNIVLVMSGKGGVGKSTVATNLSTALAKSGASVGLLDADIYGPSIPTMFGTTERPMSVDGKHILPVQRFGVSLMSIGFLLEDSTAAIVWRGPMLHSALLQFLKDVDWGDLDYLVLDLPPGTGDIALTLSQQVGASGAIIVTTPQEVALQDVYKAVSMCRKVDIGILGVVENESYFLCDGCSKRHELFGSGGGEKVAQFAEAPLIGQLPIDPSVRVAGDAGTPVVQAAPESAIAKAFFAVSGRLAEQADHQNFVRNPNRPTAKGQGRGPVRLPVLR